MRFMKGRFEGRDGPYRDATFVSPESTSMSPGLGSPAPQIDDFNPGYHAQNGLFWTASSLEDHLAST